MPNLGWCICCGGRVSIEARTCPHCGQPDPYDGEGWMAEVRNLVRQDKKIQAIKIVREYTKLDLKEAKEFVESLY